MSSKITFIYENTPDPTINYEQGSPRTLTVEIPGDVTLNQLLEQIEYFIKGIGYFPPENAHLDYVDNDTEEPKSIV